MTYSGLFGALGYALNPKPGPRGPQERLHVRQGQTSDAQYEVPAILGIGLGFRGLGFRI